MERVKIFWAMVFALILALMPGCATMGDLTGIGSSSERIEKFPEE